jgi:hypothetical protein
MQKIGYEHLSYCTAGLAKRVVRRYTDIAAIGPAHAVLEKRTSTVNPGTGKFSLQVPVKSTGVQLILVLPQTEKS